MNSPRHPFHSISTDKLNDVLGALRELLHRPAWPLNCRAKVQSKYRQVRRELDRRHYARLSALEERTGIPVASGLRAGSVIFAEPDEPDARFATTNHP